MIGHHDLLCIRPAASADTAAIDRLLDILFPHDPNRLTDAEFAQLAPGRPLAVLVAEIEADVCGFVVLRDRKARPWTGIDFIGVAPHAARRGVGKALMQAAFVHSARPVLRLFVHASNMPARALYAGMGFRHTATKSAHYPNGEDALVMMRFLGPHWMRGGKPQDSRRGRTT
jgi:[ribosomal protein S18]-alanine N-acetyltransferase